MKLYVCILSFSIKSYQIKRYQYNMYMNVVDVCSCVLVWLWLSMIMVSIEGWKWNKEDIWIYVLLNQIIPKLISKSIKNKRNKMV